MDRVAAQTAWNEARASVEAMRDVYEHISAEARAAITADPELAAASTPVLEQAAALYREPAELPQTDVAVWTLLRRVHQYWQAVERLAVLLADASELIQDEVGSSGWIRVITHARTANTQIAAIPYEPPTTEARPRARRALGGGALVLVAIGLIALFDD